MVFDPGAIVTLRNTRVGSCPECGAPGYVSSGSYSFLNDLIEVVIAPNTNIAELQELINLFKYIEENSKSLELTTQVIKEKVSKSLFLKAVIPQNRQEAIQYAGVIVTLLAAFITLKGSEEKSINIQNKIEVNNYINQIILKKYGCDK